MTGGGGTAFGVLCTFGWTGALFHTRLFRRFIRCLFLFARNRLLPFRFGKSPKVEQVKLHTGRNIRLVRFYLRFFFHRLHLLCIFGTLCYGRHYGCGYRSG